MGEIDIISHETQEGGYYMIREVILSRHQVVSLLNDLERIEATDGKPKFSCSKELEEARDLLTSELSGKLGMTKKLIENPRSITAESLDKFLSLLRKTHGEYSKFNDVCKELAKIDRPSCEQDPDLLECLSSLGEKACEAMFYSLELIIYENAEKNIFEVAIREVSDTISYEIINSILDRVTIEEWNGLFPPTLHLDPRPIDSLPDLPFPAKLEPIDPFPRYPQRTEKIETFPPGDYPSTIENPKYSPDVHDEQVWELLFGDTIKS